MNQMEKAGRGQGFIAALDQSGGSTPKALKAYGIDAGVYSNEDEMFDLIHEMRTRIITSPAFTGDRLIGAILFEQTMDREIEGRGSSEYLWDVKQVVPFLKVDKGLTAEADGVQLMKPIPGLEGLVARARSKGVFGTKMRSVIKQPNPAGIKAIVDQQFTVGKQILAGGLMPILEPEADIFMENRSEAERFLKAEILAALGDLGADQQVMLKLSIPVEDDFYADLIAHPKVLRVVALSGGYSRAEANDRLVRNHGLTASFSRALSEGLSAQQTDEEFNHMLDESIQSIYEASIT
jgi:fructose-bisphosphate aldolase class I